MGGPLVLLAVVYFSFLILRFWFRVCFTIDTSSLGRSHSVTYEQKREEKQKIKNKLKHRQRSVDIFKNLLTKPQFLKNYKLLLRKELELNQTTKGIKRRLLSDVKYEKIMQAQKSGKLSKDVLDMLN